VARCLKAQPQNRFSSAGAVANALQPRRRLLKWTAGIAAALVLLAAGAQWRTQPPAAPVRLAILPFTMRDAGVEGAAGIGLEVADRLSGARRNFTVVSPREVESNQANTAEKAKRILGATHVLETTLHTSGSQILASASLVDLRSGRSMRQMDGAYPARDTSALAKALVATVAVAFQLPSSAPKETVAPEAYSDYVQGIDLLRRDSLNADSALPLFTKAAELDPRSALPYAWMAEVQMVKFGKGDGPQWLDAAEASVAKAKSINADSVPVLSISGLVEQQHGRYEQAIREFNRAIQLAPENSDVWRRLAIVFERTNRIEEAAATYQKAIQAQPNYYRPYVDFGTFYLNRGQYGRAEEQYRRVTQLAPDLPSGHMSLGLALMQEGRYAEAEAQLLEALRLRSWRDLLINLGALYYQEQRFSEAAEYFERSLASGSPSPIQYRNLGDTYRHLQRSREASQAYRRAKTMAEDEIARNPRLASSHALLALIAAFLNDRRQAEFEIAQALAMDAENRAVIRNAAITYETLGERAKALAVLGRAPRGLLEELSRQPDIPRLQQDPDFQRLLNATR
jgi:tetratricopeptide (TPR) repeat protein